MHIGCVQANVSSFRLNSFRSESTSTLLKEDRTVYSSTVSTLSPFAPVSAINRSDLNISCPSFTIYRGAALSNLNVMTLLSQYNRAVYRDRNGIYFVDPLFYRKQAVNVRPVIRDITMSKRIAVTLSSMTFKNPLSWDECVSVAGNITTNRGSRKKYRVEGPFLVTPIGAYVENIRYNTNDQILEVFVPNATSYKLKHSLSLTRRQEYNDLKISIVPKELKPMKLSALHPSRINSNIMIDEVLIIKSRDFHNIYHNMEPINNLLHCMDRSYHCPRFRYVIIFGSNMHIQNEYSDMYDRFVINSLPVKYRPFLIDKSVLNRLKGGLYIKRALIMPILTHCMRTFNNELEAVSVMKTAYRILKISYSASKPRSLKLIYIQRSITRQIVNEKVLLEALNRDVGLEVYVARLEYFTAERQVRLFSEADVAFGVHGAGFVNILWMMPYSGVMDIMSPVFVREYYGYMSFIKRLFYSGFRNVTVSHRFKVHHVRDFDVTVDLQSLLLLIRVMTANIISFKYAMQ